MMYTLAVAVIVIFIVSIIKTSIRPANFPPGPLCLPLVGYLPFLDVRNVGRSFQLLSKKYGDVFSISIGTKKVVILNSYDAIKEAMSMKEFAGRPNMFSGTFFQRGKIGVCTTEGEVWASQRKFFHDQMVKFATSKGFEEIIMDEVDDLKLDMSKKVGENVGLAYPLNVSLINGLWTIASGRRLHSQQQEFQSVYECVDKISQFMSRAAIMSFIPILARIVPERITKMERGRYYRDRLVAISEKWIKEHKDDYRGNRSGDLQDDYIAKIKEGEKGFSDDNLCAMLRELFLFGCESMSVLLRWSFRILSVNKDVQRQVQDEIDRIVGDRAVTWEDRHGLPYTMATLAELQRFADIAPSGIPHKTTAAVQFRGFTLPANTKVLTNLNACHRDPKYWAYPDTFYPEHFLDDEGKFEENKEGFVPFGIGARQCPAVNLASKELFLIVANLLQAFSFRVPQGDNGKIGTYYKTGTSFLRNPKPFYVVLHNRK